MENDLRAFASGVAELARRSPFLAGNDTVHVILSPGAGGFTKRSRFAKFQKELDALLEKADSRPQAPCRTTVHVAAYPGHPAIMASETAETLLKEEAAGKSEGRHFIIVLGGDGTHNEVLGSLSALPDDILDRITVFRLPLGTGNDGADADTLAASAEVLAGGGEVRKAGAVRISPRGLPSFHSFNIVSLGIDAFVTGMTNRFKRILPGDVYKLIADASTLFYEQLYGVKDMKIGLHGNGSKSEITGKFILVAFGVSGGRSYGDHKKVLPGMENLCAIRTRSIREKLALKPRLYEGTHTGLPGVEMLEAERIVIDYRGRIPMQTDGEARILFEENFPCTIEVIEPRIRVLHRPA